MHASRRLLQHSLRLTLFTRENCSLCADAKGVLSRVWDRRKFEYHEIDVMAPANAKWRNLYEYDAPVVHVDRTAALSTTNSETTISAQKLMHRFTEADVEKIMDAVEGFRQASL